MITQSQLLEQQGEQIARLSEQLEDYIRGAVRNNMGVANKFINGATWQQRARELITRRESAVLEQLDPQILEQIANGKIDLPTCAKLALLPK